MTGIYEDDESGEFIVSDDDPDIYLISPDWQVSRELLSSAGEFRPPYWLSTYEDVESRDDSVASSILFPWDALKRGSDICVEIEGKNTLMISLTWPEVLTNVRFMLRNFLEGVGVARIDNSHPIFGVGRFEALRALEPERYGKCDSISRIPFPSPSSLTWSVGSALTKERAPLYLLLVRKALPGFLWILDQSHCWQQIEGLFPPTFHP